MATNNWQPMKDSNLSISLPLPSMYITGVPIKLITTDAVYTKDYLFYVRPMEQRTLRNVNNYLNTNIYSHLETSGGQSFSLYLKVVHFFNTSVNKTSVAA
jgi:hypothetical protein